MITKTEYEEFDLAMARVYHEWVDPFHAIELFDFIDRMEREQYLGDDSETYSYMREMLAYFAR